MNFCEKCKLYIENPRTVCPLCQNILIKEEETLLKEHYPWLPPFNREHRLLFRILVLFSIICCSVSLIVNFFFHEKGWWAAIVCAAVLYFWATVLNRLRTRNSLMDISNSVIVSSALLILIDFIYGFTKWSFNYALPALFLAAIASVFITSLLRGLRFSDFVIYIMITTALALLPAVFLITGITNVFLLSFICILCGVFSFVIAFVFAGQDILDELKRRFHL